MKSSNSKLLVRSSFATLVGFSCLAIPGCSQQADAEVSAKKSKYQAAADEESSASNAPPVVSSKNETIANPSVVSSGPPSNSSTSPVANAPKPGPTNGGPGVNGGPGASNAIVPNVSNTDTRSFMTIQPTKSSVPKELMSYLGTADIAFKELILGMQARQVTQDIVLERGAALGKMKLEAAEKLAEVAGNPTEKDVAVFAKIEALSQLAGFGDPDAARTLEGFAKEIATIENPKTAHQAQLVLFSFRVSEYDSGQMKTAAPLLEEMDRLLAKKELLAIPDFRMMGQTLGVLQKQGDKEAFDAARLKIADAFEENADSRLVMEAWRLKVSGSPQETALQGSLRKLIEDPDSKDALGELKAATDDMIKTFPIATTLLVLASYAMEIEVTGALDASKLLIDAAKANSELVKSPEFKQDLDRMIADATKRFDLFGKPIDLSSLSNLKGEPFDVKSLAGKVVLVDIWATWCQPCLASFPELQQTYTANREKGFEIVGVNIDAEKKDVDAFQAKSPLPWIVVRSTDPADAEAVEFKAPLARAMGVTAIPMMVLLDKKGNVVAMHLHGKKLADKIAELLAAP